MVAVEEAAHTDEPAGVAPAEPAASAAPAAPAASRPPTLAQALAAGPLTLDGGLSNQLEAQGADLGDELWSARLLDDDPAAIIAAHAAYYAAGAQVVITSSYQASFQGFATRGVDQARAAQLLRRSVELARAAELAAAEQDAREGAEPLPRWVAASVGPYGAVLADGSEYRGRYGLSVAELEHFHAPRLETLMGALPDVLALETIPDTDEARALMNIVRGSGVPCWLSFSAVGACTRAGQALTNAFAMAAEVDEVIAVGVNCCSPQDVRAAVEIAGAVTGKPVVVYPNSGEVWDAGARAWRESSTFDPGRVRTWIEAGARLVGGCCRVGPEAIGLVAAAVRGAGDAKLAPPRAPLG
ncbi:MAG TPA: homocysteine S-methyltransferase [Actinospica sp.]|jgi:S-methylmethionine-dependent homocysteine/selenocysteine methylase|nr:homocysteine S-methyltransferase [Actinospica sp.]